MVIGSWEASFHGTGEMPGPCDMSIRDTCVIVSRFSAFVSADKPFPRSDLPCLQYFRQVCQLSYGFPYCPLYQTSMTPQRTRTLRKKYETNTKTSPSHTEGASSSHPTLSPGGTAHHYLLERGHGIRTPGKAWLELQEGLESTSSATTCPGILVC